MNWLMPMLLKRGAATLTANFVKIVEVGARDGLQNEKSLITAADKIELINLLSDCNFKSIEAGALVSPKWVPQMASSEEVFKGIKKKANVSYPLLVPNMKGFQTAVKMGGVEEIAIFAAASESFSKKNINQSVEESLASFEAVTKEAIQHGIKVRGYVSCVMGCPYEGKVNPTSVINVSSRLIEMGCYEVSLGDTIGTGNPVAMRNLIRELSRTIDKSRIAVHCHDTYGMALTNVYAALEEGIRVVDSSVAGLGGCPYAPGASGNVCTEDLVYMLHSCGFETGVDFEKLRSVGDFISEKIKRANLSRVNQALKSKEKCR